MNDTMQTLDSLPEAPVADIAVTETPDMPVQQEQHDIVGEQPQEVAAAPQTSVSHSGVSHSGVSPQNQDNFRALRHAKEEAERQRDEAVAAMRKHNTSFRDEPAPDLALPKTPTYGDDDLIEGRHLNELKIQMEKQRLAMEQQRIAMETSSIEARIKSQFPDFDSVVNNSTINKLSTAYPELASTIATSTDLYSKAASAYMLMKKMGIVGGDTTSTQQVQAVQANINKPRPASQPGSSPLTQANAFAGGLTADLKKQLYKEMIEARMS